MKILGICTKTIEEVKEILGDYQKDIKIVSYFEFLKLNLSNDSNILLIDNISKLISLLNVPILDMKYYHSKWIKMDRELIKDFILNSLNEIESIDSIDYQHKIFDVNNLNEFSFITHLKEYHKDPYKFFKKVHNILTRTKKETIECSQEYKDLLKERLINPQISSLYIDFLEKKKQDYPQIFKFMKTILNRNYERKETENVSGIE